MATDVGACIKWRISVTHPDSPPGGERNDNNHGRATLWLGGVTAAAALIGALAALITAVRA
ncbi:hypothetical protein GCM10010381_43890 [Streptomyces xantholiticus]|nr:hypothetical protein GCM10010381_43890 [Streptomyces xantholiticus]